MTFWVNALYRDVVDMCWMAMLLPTSGWSEWLYERGRQYGPPNLWYPTSLHGVITQMTMTWIFTAVKIKSLTSESSMQRQCYTVSYWMPPSLAPCTSPLRWRQYGPQKHWYPTTSLQCHNQEDCDLHWTDQRVKSKHFMNELLLKGHQLITLLNGFQR
jgi:hypothetical protein